MRGAACGICREEVVAKDTRAFVPNDRVMHTLFGMGTIVECDPRKTVIEFDDNSVRKFVTSLVQLEKTLDQTPMQKPKAARKSRAKKAAAPAAKTATPAAPATPKAPRVRKKK